MEARAWAECLGDDTTCAIRAPKPPVESPLASNRRTQRTGWLPRQSRQHDSSGEGLPNGVVGSREAGMPMDCGIWATEVPLNRAEAYLHSNSRMSKIITTLKGE